MNARPLHHVIHRPPGARTCGSGAMGSGVTVAVSWLQALTDLGYAGDKVRTTC